MSSILLIIRPATEVALEKGLTNRHVPIEVKHRTTVDQIGGLKSFMGRFKLPFGCIITRDQTVSSEDNVLYLPLRYFLLAT